MGLYNGFGLEKHKNGNKKYEGYFYEGQYDGDTCIIDHSNGIIAFKGRMVTYLF